jgi:hypothetical protein
MSVMNLGGLSGYSWLSWFANLVGEGSFELSMVQNLLTPTLLESQRRNGTVVIDVS